MPVRITNDAKRFSATVEWVMMVVVASAAYRYGFTNRMRCMEKMVNPSSAAICAADPLATRTITPVRRNLRKHSTISNHQWLGR